MKDLLIGLIVVALIVGGIVFFTSDTFADLTHPGQKKIAGVWVEDKNLAKYDFGGGAKEVQANINGDTYCKKCDKFAEGKVRICPYCGQYI
jgi:hypothetical protein